MIISRYLLKEVFNTLLAVTFALLLIFLSHLLVRYLGYAASGKIAPHVMFQLIEFEVPYLLSMLLPLGLYLGIILAYGRLYADSELRVLHACGFTMRNLFTITSALAVLTSLVVVILMLWVNPMIAAEKERMLANDGAGSFLDTLMPGRFQVSNDGRRVVYVEKISRNHREADNLFIADQKNSVENTNSPWTVLSAASGYQHTDRKTHERFVTATDGARYEGVPGQNDYKMIQFKKYTLRMPDAIIATRRQAEEAITTTKLLRTYNNPDNAAELQWRLSVPLSAFLLALLAVPLSQVAPRQGRYSMLLTAILIYVIYVNLLFAARNLVEQKMVPLSIGMWWVHPVALLIPGLLLFAWRKKST